MPKPLILCNTRIFTWHPIMIYLISTCTNVFCERRENIFPDLKRGLKKPCPANGARRRQNRRQSRLGSAVEISVPFGPKGQIANVNSYINGLEDLVEITSGAKSKSWTKPANIFKCGDSSEDFAMAKYNSLLLLGFHLDHLRMVWLVEDGQSIYPAVVLVNLRGNVFVLDSRSDIISTEKMLSQGHLFCSLNVAKFNLHWDQSNP